MVDDVVVVTMAPPVMADVVKGAGEGWGGAAVWLATAAGMCTGTISPPGIWIITCSRYWEGLDSAVVKEGV